MASYGEKFDAAVTVIKRLPKQGSFQPSYDMMKRFYGLYKQATEGPCTESKPPFWNVIQTQKWQAWTSLGDLDGEKAKEMYVDELLKIILANSKAKDIPEMYQIIETMPQTEEVVTFLKVLGPFFELVTESEANEEEEEEEVTSALKVTKVNGHLVNGEVKMLENGVDEQGDGTKGLTNGSHTQTSDLPNGHLVNGHGVDRQSVAEARGRAELEERDGGAENDAEDDETRDQRFVLVGSAQQGDDAAELSHPILVSRSQLEASDKQRVTSSDSESDGEFCDSVDEPLGVNLNHTPIVTPLPAIPEKLHLTSTPFNAANTVVTEAEVHNNVDAVVIPHYSTSLTSAPTTPVPSSRGGGEVTSGSKDQQGQRSSRQSGQGNSSGRGSVSFQSSGPQGSHDRSDGAVGGGGGGGRTPGGGGSPRRSPIPDDVVEQITVSLERLQRDMNSVLVRLNTLETIAVSRQQRETQQAYMTDGQPETRTRSRSSPFWWPFPNLPFKTVFILLVWPFIVQWFLRFLARSRRTGPRHR